MSRFWVIFVRIFPAFRLNAGRYSYLSVFSPNAGKCGKNVDQNNSKYGHFLRSAFLTHFMSLVSFYTPWKGLTKGFLMFSGGIERDQRHEIVCRDSFLKVRRPKILHIVYDFTDFRSFPTVEPQFLQKYILFMISHYREISSSFRLFTARIVYSQNWNIISSEKYWNDNKNPWSFMEMGIP